jgi:hypothetical protein
MAKQVEKKLLARTTESRERELERRRELRSGHATPAASQGARHG